MRQDGRHRSGKIPTLIAGGGVLNRRLIAGVLAGLLVFASAHFCVSRFALPSGETCADCPTLADPVVPEILKGEVVTPHGDCHDCCTLEKCEDHDQGRANGSVPPTPEYASDLPSKASTAPATIVVGEWDRIVHTAGHPAKGPPGAIRSRAPPRLRLALS